MSPADFGIVLVSVGIVAVLATIAAQELAQHRRRVGFDVWRDGYESVDGAVCPYATGSREWVVWTSGRNQRITDEAYERGNR